MSSNFYKSGLILAGLSNILGVLIFSRFFTNEVVNQSDPTVMSNFGLLMIIVWGLAYIATSTGYKKVKWLIAVFAVEKLIYSLVWINWHYQNDIKEIFQKDTMAGVFYSIYGINDIVFLVFFIILFFHIFNLEKGQNTKQ